MEAALEVYNNNNLIVKEQWRQSSCDANACNLFNVSDSIETVDKSSLAELETINIFKDPNKFIGVTGRGVLLWLPPAEGVVQQTSSNNSSVAFQNVAATKRNIIINICPTGASDDTQLATKERSSEMERKCLVNLIATKGNDGIDSPSFRDGELVTVVDLSIKPRLLLKIKTQDDVNSLTQSIIDHFQSSSSMQYSAFGESEKSFCYSVVYKVLSKESSPPLDAGIANGEYQSDSPKKSSKERKTGKKNKRESTIFGNEKKSKFTCDEDIASQVKILGFREYKACNLKASIKDVRGQLLQKPVANRPKQIDGSSRAHSVCIQIDLAGAKLPNGVQIDIIDNYAILRCASGIFKFNTLVKLKVSDTQVFKERTNACYFEKEDMLNILSEIQDMQPSSMSKKNLLCQHFSEDSEIRCKDFMKGLPDTDLLKTDGQTQRDDKFSSDDIVKEDSLYLNNNYITNKFCDINGTTNTKSKLDCKGSIPTYLISQSLEKLTLTIYCGVGLQLETLRVVQHSHHLVSVSYVNSATSSIPLKFCLGLSSINLDQQLRDQTDSVQEFENIKRKVNQDDCSKEEIENLSSLHNVEISNGKLFLEIEKSCSGNWATVWIGQASHWKEIALVEAEIKQVPVSLRLTESLSAAAEAEKEGGVKHDDGQQALPIKSEDEECEETENQCSDKPEDDGPISSEKSETLPQDGSDHMKISVVNVNKNKTFGDVLAIKSNKDNFRTKNSVDNESFNCSASDNSSNKSKKITKAVKSSISPVEDKENQEQEVTDVDDEKQGKELYCIVASNSNDGVSVHQLENEGALQTSVKELSKQLSWPQQGGKRLRRSSESVSIDGRKASLKDRLSPPLSASGRPRSILKRRGRSLSESHIGSVEECLGEELLGKYCGSVERALVGEYGCLEGLLEECGELDDDAIDGCSGTSVGSKKSVRFNDVEKTHLFMSKASIVNQLANDDKKAMRSKMKDNKRKMKLEKRQAQKSGNNFNSSYRSNNGYNSFDDEATTEESDGAELATSSSGGDTSDTTSDNDTDNSDTPSKPSPQIMEPSSMSVDDRSSSKASGKKRGKRNKNKRVVLSNNMIFQLDMEA